MKLFAKLEDHRCFVKVEVKKLFRCEILADGSVDESWGNLNWKQIKNPVDPNFLEAANRGLGISLRESDFEHVPDIRRRE